MEKKNAVGYLSGIKPASTEEHIVSVIPAVYRWTFLGAKQWFDLIVTERRLVFVRIEDDATRRETYESRKIAQILAENKKNVAIELKHIKSFKYTPGRGIEELCGKHQEIDGQMNIRTSEAKYNFYVLYRYDRVAREALTAVGLYSKEPSPEIFRGI